MTNHPGLWIFAGPNGAGKSTLVDRFKISEYMPVVNPDNIAVTLDSNYKKVQAGRIALKEREKLLNDKVSFAIETTLTGKKEKQLVADAKNKGYKIYFVYVGVPSPLLSSQRVEARVRAGGHNVPKDDIYRRYKRSMDNIQDLMKKSDRSYIFDNSGKKHRLLLSVVRQAVKSVSKNMPNWAKNSIPADMRQIKKNI